MSGKIESLSVYIHVPFCIKKCPYCHFYSESFSEDKKNLYLKYLLMELDLYQSLLVDRKIVSIYFGGGTPSLFPAKEIEGILKKIPHEADCEITLEANPERISYKDLSAFRSTGINRISFGVQSLFDPSLEILKRRHRAKDAIKAIEETTHAGINNISIDLMYDLPHQTKEGWNYSLEKAVSLPVTHISLYNLTIEPNTYFDRIRDKILPTIPCDEKSAIFLEDAVTTFQKNDFQRYEISAFAKEGNLSIHNTGYWTGRDFIGIGPSAFSYIKGIRTKNVSNLEKYCQTLSDRDSPIDFEEKLSPKAHIRELVAINLRMVEGIDLITLQEKHGTFFDEEFQSIFQSLIEENLLERVDSKYRLTEKGLLFYDTVAERIIL